MFSALINQKKTKYRILDEIIPDLSGRVNLYIDLRTVFSQFWSNRFNDETILSSFTYIDIISEIVNIAGHYCGYFIKNQLPVDYLSCYLLYSDKVSKEKRLLCPDYKKSFLERRHGKTSVIEKFNRKFTKCLELLPEVLECVPRIFFIDTDEMDPYDVVRGFIRKKSTDVYHFIITNDIQYFPYISNKDKTFVLTMKSDSSSTLTEKNVFSYLTEGNKVCDDCPLKAEHILPLLSIVGHKKNDVNGIGRIGFTNGVKFLSNLINAGIIPSGELLLKDYEKIFAEYPKEIGWDVTKIDIFKRNWKLFTTRRAELKFTTAEKTYISNQMTKYVDFDTLMNMNHKSFRTNPLNLEFMFITQ
jgi:hypothetical protein